VQKVLTLASLVNACARESLGSVSDGHQPRFRPWRLSCQRWIAISSCSRSSTADAVPGVLGAAVSLPSARGSARKAALGDHPQVSRHAHVANVDLRAGPAGEEVQTASGGHVALDVEVAAGADAMVLVAVIQPAQPKGTEAQGAELGLMDEVGCCRHGAQGTTAPMQTLKSL